MEKYRQIAALSGALTLGLMAFTPAPTYAQKVDGAQTQLQPVADKAAGMETRASHQPESQPRPVNASGGQGMARSMGKPAQLAILGRTGPDPAGSGSLVQDSRAADGVATGAYAEALPALQQGPPMPKARRGRLAQIDWPKAPASVSPALEEAINLVTRTYPSADSARAALRGAAADLRAARQQWLPSLSAQAVAYDPRFSPESQLLVSQPLWTSGRIESGIRRARASEDASSAQYVDTVQTLALTTAQVYYDIVRLTIRGQLLADSLREHQNLVATMERRVANEVSPLADLKLARSRTEQVALTLNAADAARATSIRIMAQLVADSAYDLGPVPAYTPDLTLTAPDRIEEEAVAYSPYLRVLEAQVRMADAEHRQRRAAILPQLNAQYSYDEYLGHRAGVMVSTYNSVSQFSEVRSASERILQVEEEARSAEAQLRRDVESDLIDLRSAQARTGIAADAANTAAAVSESYMRQFVAGRRSWLDVMNGLREAVDARIQQSEAEVTVMAAATRLLLKSGRWRPKFDTAN